MYSDFKRENESNLCHSAIRAMGSIGVICVIVHLDFQNVGALTVVIFKRKNGKDFQSFIKVFLQCRFREEN
jgi:hypothetical protein